MPTENAGILIVPSTIGFWAKEDEGEFEAALVKAMTEAVSDPSSAGATLPFIVRAPATAVAGIRYVPFATVWDEFIGGF